MPIIYSTKQLRPRNSRDFYPTHQDLVYAILNKYLEINHKIPKFILDPGAGNGVWGRVARNIYKTPTIVGIENNLDIIKDALPDKAYNIWDTRDYLKINDMNPIVDLVIGNPPYRFANEFVSKSYDLLSPEGSIVFLLPLAFLESKYRYDNFYTKQLRPSHVFVLTKRPSFTENRKTDATAYAMFVWTKKERLPITILDWLSWKYESSNDI